MAGEPYTPYQETTPPLQAEEMGPSAKRINRDDEPHRHSTL
jgi:hypothetical protein